ncbi:hypothetical protein O181_085137 [Austropuccinia psidii MF-1]|uniref:Uncharacterized protein n=1 Tax=Austropuccinia psidii MF-1 TaxID=1389203 RepID=A0A9Q3FVH7_9BASI|nr:hypothetical protein [Austropuccinia psidii MF-1]
MELESEVDLIPKKGRERAKSPGEQNSLKEVPYPRAGPRNARSHVKPKEEIKNPFITDLSHQYNNQVLMKEAPQLKEWPSFTGEGEYDHISFIKTIDMLRECYAIPDELITSRLHWLFVKSAKRWYYGIIQTNGKNT